jgi:AraC-like DNA-binding protein
LLDFKQGGNLVEIKRKVLYYIILHLFEHYPYLVDYIFMEELARELNINVYELRRIIKKLQRQALRKMEEERQRERKKLEKEIEKAICMEELIGH